MGKIFDGIGSYALPMIITMIVVTGLIRCKGSIFSIFIDGAKSGITTIFSIMPSLIGLVTAVEMLNASGAVDLLANSIKPIATAFHIPPEILPMIILRPVSGSGCIALLDNILKSCGADSMAGRYASVICASGETTFYTSTLYFGAVKAKNIRHTLIAALIADFTGVVMSCISVGLFLY